MDAKAIKLAAIKAKLAVSNPGGDFGGVCRMFS
jgi:hypothetical protein